MKSNWFKYIFISFVIAIMIFAIIKIKSDEGLNNSVQEQATANSAEKIKEIKLGIAQLDTLNPIVSNNKNVKSISKLIYEPLINLTVDYKAEGCLAKEWAKQSETTYLIKLRENVKWSDGKKFIAEDVKFTIDRLKDTNSVYSTNVQSVISVEIVDDYTIRINLDKEVPFFEYNLTFPIMSSEYYEAQDFVTTERNKSPIGTGKYKISDVQGSYITLIKNTNWWNKSVELTLEKITINLYSSVGELYNSFKLGNIDIISTTNNNLESYIGSIGYSTKEIKGREHSFLAFNTQNYFLSNIAVRKAISYSIDKENIISSVFNNKASISSFPLDFGSFVYKEQNASSGYNLEQAKQILVDDGWSFRYQYWQKVENYKTQKMSLNLLVKDSDSSNVTVAKNIKDQLANQGIVINIIQASNDQYNNSLQNKNYDIVLCSMYLSASPNLNTFFGDDNYANYYNEEVKNILAEVKNTTDDTILVEKYKRLSEIYKTEIPYISLYNNKYIMAYNSAIGGDINPNWYNLFYGVESWYK